MAKRLEKLICTVGCIVFYWYDMGYKTVPCLGRTVGDTLWFYVQLESAPSFDADYIRWPYTLGRGRIYEPELLLKIVLDKINKDE